MKPFYTSVEKLHNKLYYRGVDENGQRVLHPIKFQPSMYFVDPELDSKYRTLDGRPLEKKTFPDISSAYNYLEPLKDLEGYEVFGQPNYAYQYIQNNFPGDIEYDASKISIATLDIETECEDGFPDIILANEEIICLTLYESITNVFYIYSLKGRGRVDPKRFEEYKSYGEEIACLEFDTESEMLAAFLRKWSKELNYPDIVTGWNLEFFDIPYLVNRLYKIFDGKYVDKRLSPWGNIWKREVAGKYGREQITYKIGGVRVLDYMAIYKKFKLQKQESYSLSHIAYVELGEKKLSYEEYDSMHLFYLEDYPKFVEYNLKDVWLINRLDDKIRFLDLAITLAYMSKVNYDDVFFPVRLIESLCYDHLLNKNIVVHDKNFTQNQKAQYVGGFVKDPQVGLHNWVVSFDLNSLYPSIIRQLNLSPETLRPELENRRVTIDTLLEGGVDLSYADKQNVAVAANGHHFSRERLGFLPKIVKELVEGRNTVKGEMLEAKQKLEKTLSERDRQTLEYEISFKDLKQQALKVLANSIYGAMGNQYFAFYDTRLASAITEHGQFVIRLIEKELNRFMNALLKTEGEDYVVYMDTDSVYISFKEIVQRYKKRTGETDINKIVDYIDRVCQERVEKWIDKVYSNMASETNAYEPHMVMKREAIASRGVWTAKKRYALYVYDNEGVRYAEPKMKVTGMETQRSSTPEWCRKKLKTALKKVLTQDEVAVQDYAIDVRKEYDELDPSVIAFPRSVNGIEKWTDGRTIKKRTPIQVRSSHKHNIMIHDMKLDDKYRYITSGNKIKFLYLHEPNPAKYDVIAFANSLPEEFGLHDYVDYDLMFYKSFQKPLQNVLNVIGWDVEKGYGLEIEFG